MKIYKCDRCNQNIDYHVRNKVFTREWDNTIDKFDLCDKCFEKFRKFIYCGRGDYQ